MSNLTPNIPFQNKISTMHMPNESAAPPIAFVPVSGITILGTALSAYTPPRGLFIVVSGDYKAYTFGSNIASGLIASLPISSSLTGLAASTSAIIFSVAQAAVPFYFSGAFNKVTLGSGAEVASLSSAYFAW